MMLPGREVITMPRSVEESLDHPRGLPDEAEFRRPDDEFGVEVYVHTVRPSPPGRQPNKRSRSQ